MRRPGGRSTADLEQRTIAISRPVGEGQDTSEIVRGLGWTPFIFHTVELKPLSREKIQDQIQSSFRDAVPDWIVFMSPTGTKLFFDNLTYSDREMMMAPKGSRFLAVGPRTREYLLGYGVKEVFVPKRYSSTGIDEWFAKSTTRETSIVLVRSSSADDSLADSLRSRGAHVATLNVYESAIPRDTQSILDLLAGLRAGRFGAVLFTSAVSVSNFFKVTETKFQGSEVTRLLKSVTVGAIGSVTGERLRDMGIEAVVPDEYMIENAAVKLITTLSPSIMEDPSSRC